VESIVLSEREIGNSLVAKAGRRNEVEKGFI
jgi:hypothetical protein